MPHLTLQLTPTQANALRDLMAISHIPGDICLSAVFEELSRYLDAMDDYAAEAANMAAAEAYYSRSESTPALVSSDCPF